MSVGAFRSPSRSRSQRFPAGFFAELFAEAWEHRRQRYRQLGLGAAMFMAFAALVAGLLVGASGHDRSSTPVAATFSSLTPDQGLGDHCAVINSVACDTIEFDVELKSPARSVVASIGHRAMELQPIPNDDGFPAPGEITGVGSGPWTGFYGYLQPSPTRTAVRNAVTAAPPKDGRRRTEYLYARLFITFGDGRHRIATVASRPLRAYINPPGGVAQKLAQAAAAILAQQPRRTSHPG